MAKTKTQPNTEVASKLLQGVVVSNKMQNTIIVQVDRFVKHPRYGKYYTISKKYKVHTADAKAHSVGETVTIKACRPISKDKSFMVVQ